MGRRWLRWVAPVSGAVALGLAGVIVLYVVLNLESPQQPDAEAATSLETVVEAPSTVPVTTSSTTTSTTSTTTTFPPTTTTSPTIPPEDGLGLALVGGEAYWGAVPLYLFERIGDQTVSGRSQDNIAIGIATLVPQGVEIRAPLGGLLTTFEFYEGDEDSLSLTRKQALLQTDVFSPEGDRLIIRWGTNYEGFRFTHGDYAVDRRVEAGDVIGVSRGPVSGSTIDWPRLGEGYGGLSVFDRDYNLFLWGEWGSRSTAGERVLEWFPALQGMVATSQELGERSYSTINQHVVSVRSAAAPTWGLRPALLWLPDTGDDPSASDTVIDGVGGAVAFVASWSGFDTSTGDGYEAAMIEVSCLLRFIRAEGPRFGADPDRVTVAGHGDGGVMAISVAAAPEAIAAAPEGACDYWAEPATVTGAVAVGGTFVRGIDLEGLPAGLAATVAPSPVPREGARYMGFVLSDLDEEADPYAITAFKEVMAEAGHEVAEVRADATHDQLLNAAHGRQGWPAVQMLNAAVKWSPIAERFWTAVGSGDGVSALAELGPEVGPTDRAMVEYLAAFELDFVPFTVPSDGGEFVVGMPGSRRCREEAPGVVNCEYRVTNQSVIAALARGNIAIDADGECKVTVDGAIASFTVPAHAEVGIVLASYAASEMPEDFAANCGVSEGTGEATVYGVPATAECGTFLAGLLDEYVG